ncbi:triose-phosphate isomerase [Flavobacteriales bacterium]|nr:triose-phosphate isomerase [Flavobacteriales bacterium]
MRKKIVAGNWKMNFTKHEARTLVEEVLSLLAEVNLTSEKQVVFSPPSIYLESISKITEGLALVHTASQNIFNENSGAYTGELSAAMVKSVGADYTLIGHSERRDIFGETNELLAKKVVAAIEHQLIPIYCCGEHLEDRKTEQHFSIIQSQLEKGLFELPAEEFKKVVIAYEPVWAIGTGETATADQAQEIHAYIRKMVQEKYGEEIANNLTILYGGSCKPSNALELFSCTDVDGGLIGGASLKASDFVKIVGAL